MTTPDQPRDGSIRLNKASTSGILTHQERRAAIQTL
jgi:hypothetical protein